MTSSGEREAWWTNELDEAHVCEAHGNDEINKGQGCSCSESNQGEGSGRRKSFCLELSPSPTSKRLKKRSVSEDRSCVQGEEVSGCISTGLSQAEGDCTMRNSRSESILSGVFAGREPQGTEWSPRGSCVTVSSMADRPKNLPGGRNSQGAARSETEAGATLEANSRTNLLVLARDQHGKRLLPSELVGVVPIPDYWPGELHLRDWIETKQVEKGLRPMGLQVAREAMILDGFKQHSASLPLQLNTASTVISA